MKRTVKQIVTVAALVALTACAPERVQITPPPVYLTFCQAEPAAPSLPPVPWGTDTARTVQGERDKATLEFILALVEAGGDCRAKVAGLAEWAEGVR